MRFKIEMQLTNEKFPIDYRPSIISFLKYSLTNYNDGEFFQKYYGSGKEKEFSFAVEMPNAKFTKELIQIDRKSISIVFSTIHMATGILFFNALMSQRQRAFNIAFENSMTITDIILQQEELISTEDIDVVFKSPLCVREHIKENNKDLYYSYGKEGFEVVFKKVIKRQIEGNRSLNKQMVDELSFIPINAKKTVVKHHSQFVEVTLGSFNIKANSALLNYLYNSGIGSRKSGGFGLFEIIRKEKL